MYVRVNNLENGRYIYRIHCTFEMRDSIASENISFSMHWEESLPLYQFLGDFVKLWEAIISFFISECPSACFSAHLEQLGSHKLDIHEIW